MMKSIKALGVAVISLKLIKFAGKAIMEMLQNIFIGMGNQTIN